MTSQDLQVAFELERKILEESTNPPKTLIEVSGIDARGNKFTELLEVSEGEDAISTQALTKILVLISFPSPASGLF